MEISFGRGPCLAELLGEVLPLRGMVDCNAEAHLCAPHLPKSFKLPHSDRILLQAQVLLPYKLRFQLVQCNPDHLDNCFRFLCQEVFPTNDLSIGALHTCQTSCPSGTLEVD